MLRTRLITAVILFTGFCLSLFLASTSVFGLLVSFVVAAAAWEWSRLSGVAEERVQTALAAVIGLLVLIALHLPQNEELLRWLFLGGFLFWAAVPAVFYLAVRHAPVRGLDVGMLLTGAFLLLVTAMAIQYLRSAAPDASAWLLLYALGVVWCMDIGAYFTGRRFGRRKLAPAISPGKTWEGVYGGIVVTLCMLVLVLLLADWAQGKGWKIAAATALSAIASILGDLYESRVKRASGVKDSSQMLPGHGGVLDRIDALLSALPVFAFVWAWS